MTGKFFRRTFRNLLFRERPYFAHLALTHRCNLRCRFCHVTENRFEELDTERMKRVVDVLDEAGVAVISISGGGEPLLREDFDIIIDHAAELGLYVKLTSNGTMPRAKYERLLKSRVDEIGISLDGVKGHDLPFSHVGPQILGTLKYLNDNLPAGRHLTVNATISATNRGEAQEILAYCEEHYPKARVWLNPVVAGEGALRTKRAERCAPDYLETARSETRLKAEFYNAGAKAQYEQERFDWGCLAGDLFFDVKPNGDYWLCQDQPSATPLNVLDPQFAAKRALVSKEQRRRCEGCLYSCYFMVQKSFEPRHWRDVGLMWWQTNTEPGGRERAAAKKYGPWGALASLALRNGLGRAAQPALRAVAVLALAVGMACGQEQAAVNPEEVLTRMEAAGAQQRLELKQWRSERTYRAENAALRRRATAKVAVEYKAPGTKTWTMLETAGSGLIVNRVIKPLLEAEQESARPEVRPASDVGRANYRFRYLGYDETLRAYLFEAAPLNPSKYQFRGRVAVDAETYGIRKTWGEPAVRPSFWVKKTAFEHEYGRIGGYWLPVRHRTRVQLRIFGSSTLEIDYGGYRVEGSAGSSERTPEVALRLGP